MASRRTLDVGAELGDAHGKLGNALGRLAAFAAIAERLDRLPEGTVMPQPNVIVRYGSSPDHDVGELPGDTKDVRDNFAAYCARFAVIGMVTACEEFLQRVLFLANLGLVASRSDGQLTGSKFDETRTQVRKQVRNTSIDGLPIKILGIVKCETSPLPEIEWFRGIYGIRKCLLHRGGLIGQDDISDTGQFTATWRRPLLRIGDREVTDLPALAEEGDNVSVQFVDANQEWRIGESINLTAQDCQDIAFTLSAFCGRVSALFGEGLRQLLKEPSS